MELPAGSVENFQLVYIYINISVCKKWIIFQNNFFCVEKLFLPIIPLQKFARKLDCLLMKLQKLKLFHYLAMFEVVFHQLELSPNPSLFLHFGSCFQWGNTNFLFLNYLNLNLLNFLKLFNLFFLSLCSII